MAMAACAEEVDTHGFELSKEVDPGEPVERDLAGISDIDTLDVLLTTNSTGYFLYRGTPKGFEYELLRAFAQEHDLVFNPTLVSNRDSIFYRLNRGDGDVAAARLVPNAYDSAHVAFSRPLYETRPAVVQRERPLEDSRLPDTVDTLLSKDPPRTLDSVQQIAESVPPESIEARLITRPEGLAGETIFFPTNPAYEERLVELSEEVTGDIHVVELSGEVSAEALIRRVAEGEVGLTISHENVARLRESYYTNIAVVPTVDPEHEVAWAVRQNAPELLEALNAFIENNPGMRQNLYDTYFRDRQGYQERIADEYLTSETGRLSEYDGIIQQYADTIGWDWRLLAAQTYQESKFQPRARSWAGAMGLLQLMPPTARQFGVGDPYDPQDNVAGATRFLTWLENYWDEEIADSTERRKFILASYNTGHGHVEDARRLAQKNGDDTEVWDEVAYWLLQKSKRKYYTDPVVKYGFARGLEPVTYVSRILDRYENYRQFVTETGEAATARLTGRAEEDEGAARR